MPVLRTVFVWPPSGHRDRPWSDDPDEDALLRGSRAVCDRYSEGLADLGLTHKVSSVRIWLSPPGQHLPSLSGGLDVEHLGAGRPESFEAARIRVPAGFAGWDLARRQVATLDAVHRVMTTMAQARGITGAERLDSARRHVVEQDFGFCWDGPWKAARRRRGVQQLAARCRYVLAGDGFGRLTVEIARVQPGGHQVVATSGPHDAWTTARSFRRSAGTLRWDGADSLVVVPSVPPFMVLAGPGLVLSINPDLTVRETTAELEFEPGTRPADDRPPGERVRGPQVQASAAEQGAAARSGKVAARKAIALEGDPELLPALAADGSAQVRRAVAGRPEVPVELLRQLARDDDRLTREAVAGNPSTPPDALVVLIADEHWRVAYAVMTRTGLPLAVQEAALLAPPKLRSLFATIDGLDPSVDHRLATDPDPSVRTRRVERTTDPALLQMFSTDPHAMVRTSVVANDAAGPELTEMLSRDPSSTVRAAVATFGRLTHDQWMRLASDRAEPVQDAVVHASDVPGPALQFLVEHGSPRIASGASHALGRRG